MHTLKLWKSSKIKKSFQTPEWSSTFSTPPWGGSQAPSPRCQEASGRTMVLVTVRIRTRLSHRPGADGYGNRLQSYNTFLCPKHEQRSWDTEEVWKLGDKNQVGSLHTMHREVAHGTQEEDKTGHSQHGWPVAKSCSTPWTGAPASLPGFTAPHCLPEFTNSCPLRQWCYPIISSSAIPSAFAFSLSQHQGTFFNESTLGITWPKYWSFSFSISLSDEY